METKDDFASLLAALGRTPQVATSLSQPPPQQPMMWTPQYFQPVVAPTPQPTSNSMYIWIIAILLLALLGLGAILWIRSSKMKEEIAEDSEEEEVKAVFPTKDLNPPQEEEEDLNDNADSNWYWLDESVVESMIPKKKIIPVASGHNDNNSGDSGNINNLTIDTTTTTIHNFRPIAGTVGTMSPLESEDNSSPLGGLTSQVNATNTSPLPIQQQQQQHMFPSIWYNERHTSESEKIQRFTIKLSYNMVKSLLQMYNIPSCTTSSSHTNDNNNDNGSISTSGQYGLNGSSTYSYNGHVYHVASDNNNNIDDSSYTMTNTWLTLKNFVEGKFSVKVCSVQ